MCANSKISKVFFTGDLWKRDERSRVGSGCRGRWRVWLWQGSPGGLWDSLSEAIPSMGGLIRFITSQISGGACCQDDLSAWLVIRARNEDRARLRPGRAQMMPRPGGVEQARASHTDYRDTLRLMTVHLPHKTLSHHQAVLTGRSDVRNCHRFTFHFRRCSQQSPLPWSLFFLHYSKGVVEQSDWSSGVVE